MKKIFSLITCVMLAMMLCVACGDKESEKEESKKDNTVVNIDVAATADSLLDNIAFVDEMTAIESVDFFAALFSIEKEDVKEQKSYTSTGATAEMVSAVKCKDAEAAKRVKAAFEAYTKDLSGQYADYKPEECEKLDNPVIKVYNEYVIICVSDENDKAVKKIEEQVK